MRKFVVATAILTLGALLAVNVTVAEEKKEEKPMSTHDIMEKGFKGGKSLLRKVTSTKDDPTEEEVKTFLKMLKDLNKNKPEKGDVESWKKLTEAMLKPMEDIAKGEDVKKNQLALKKAANCGKCHKAHKPSKDE